MKGIEITCKRCGHTVMVTQRDGTHKPLRLEGDAWKRWMEDTQGHCSDCRDHDEEE